MKKQIKKIIESFKTKYDEGFTTTEIIMLLENFPEIDMDVFYEQLDGTDGIIINDNYLLHKQDIKTALLKSA